MPLPKPSSDTSKTPANKKKFLSSCMGNSVMLKEFPDQSQRFAVCERQWGEKKSKAILTYASNDDEFIVEEEIEQK